MPSRDEIHSQPGLIDAASEELKLLGAELGVVGCWSWSPRGDRILFAGEPERTWQLDLFVYQVGSGEISQLSDDVPILPDAG